MCNQCCLLKWITVRWNWIYFLDLTNHKSNTNDIRKLISDKAIPSYTCAYNISQHLILSCNYGNLAWHTFLKLTQSYYGDHRILLLQCVCILWFSTFNDQQIIIICYIHHVGLSISEMNSVISICTFLGQFIPSVIVWILLVKSKVFAMYGFY